jgi:hypothetical protein
MLSSTRVAWEAVVGLSDVRQGRLACLGGEVRFPDELVGDVHQPAEAVRQVSGAPPVGAAGAK